MDSWPTQPARGDNEGDPQSEKTRIGVPAYDPKSAPPQRHVDPALRPSQALRVVVWRAADGVHIAPHGTRVSAITVEAVLVSLDPSADLATWLSGR
jgi:hypothetical protein